MLQRVKASIEQFGGNRFRAMFVLSIKAMATMDRLSKLFITVAYHPLAAEPQATRNAIFIERITLDTFTIIGVKICGNLYTHISIILCLWNGIYLHIKYKAMEPTCMV